MTLRRLRHFSTGSLLICSLSAASASMADRLSEALQAAITHHPAVVGQATTPTSAVVGSKINCVL